MLASLLGLAPDFLGFWQSGSVSGASHAQKKLEHFCGTSSGWETNRFGRYAKSEYPPILVIRLIIKTKLRNPDSLRTLSQPL